VLPSRFEGYGMAYAEAIAHGVPVIGTTAGAIPQTVPASAGVLVPPDDVPALTTALQRLIETQVSANTWPPARRLCAFPPGSDQAERFAPSAGSSVAERLL